MIYIFFSYLKSGFIKLMIFNYHNVHWNFIAFKPKLGLYNRMQLSHFNKIFQFFNKVKK